jgi:hypothetical protein
LCAIAITDHDTTAGVEPARAAGLDCGVEVVPGVEISAEHSIGKMHILAYFIDPEETALCETLRRMNTRREQRNERIVERLNELGMPVSMDEVRSCAVGEVVGRPHIAQLLVKKGFVVSVRDAFNRFLRTGAAASVEKEKLPPDEVIRIIHGAGGVAVLAHPYQLLLGDGEKLAQFVSEMASDGLDGIECFYPEHSPEQTVRYSDLATRYGLVATGGSDFHGIEPDRSLGLEPPVSSACIAELKARRPLDS